MSITWFLTVAGFIVDVLRETAWPITILIIVLTLKQELRNAIKVLSERIKKVGSGKTKVEFVDAWPPIYPEIYDERSDQGGNGEG